MHASEDEAILMTDVYNKPKALNSKYTIEHIRSNNLNMELSIVSLKSRYIVLK